MKNPKHLLYEKLRQSVSESHPHYEEVLQLLHEQMLDDLNLAAQ